MLAPKAQAMPTESRAPTERDDLDGIEGIDGGERRPDHDEPDQEERDTRRRQEVAGATEEVDRLVAGAPTGDGGRHDHRADQERDVDPEQRPRTLGVEHEPDGQRREDERQ